ncbi:AbiJ-NTD4 domain-containing protein [Hyphomonas sp.]|uniref:AbiJ-NTD4 domain-containing protein n=1 Tax=Hyphomonas sp. TaxID=87 RepID=UPI00391D6A9B
MITDIFARRYEHVPVRTGYGQDDARLMLQASEMIHDRLWLGYKPEKTSEVAERCIKEVHDALALELGRQYLSDRFWVQTTVRNGDTYRRAHTNTYAKICKKFLELVPPDTKNADQHIKERVSFVELAFRQRMVQIETENLHLREIEQRDAQVVLAAANYRIDSLRTQNLRMNENFKLICDELNERMRMAGYPLTYHNGMIQFATDTRITAQIEQPFWTLVSAPLWKNVDEQMKEAFDRRDRGDRTAAFHAACALESAIKIISDTKNWTRGTEKGASYYIDNLVSQKNGRFIEVWESEMLKTLFSDVRAPFAHGPGQAPMPQLSSEQTDWAIDTAMSWIKALIRRM